MPVRLDTIPDEDNQPIRLDRLDTPSVRLDQIDKPAIGLQPMTLLGQSFMQSMADKPAMMLRGTEVFTPEKYGGKQVDPLLRKTSLYLESLKDPDITNKVTKAREGKLWPVGPNKSWYQVEAQYLPEVINAWAANVGDQIPIMFATIAGRALGRLTGKGIGAVAGAAAGAATAGPDPTDVATVPAVYAIVSKITEHIGGAAPMIAMEAGGFMDEASRLGIDKDIAEKYARLYGPASGAIEYAQHLWTLGAYNRIPKRAKVGIVMKVLKEIGGGAVEGLEEMSQGGLQRHLLNKAIDEMQEIHPGYAGEKQKLFEGSGREFALGAGVSLLTRMPAHGYRTVQKGVERRALSKEQKEVVDQATWEKLDTPMSIETAEGLIGFEDEFLDVQERIKEEQKAEFKAPGIGKIFTPKWLLNRMIGVEPLLKDVEAAELARGIEEQHLGQWITKTMKQLKKRASLGDRVASRIANKPVHAIRQMRDLLDTYEDAPDWLDKEQARTFNQVRELTRYMRDRANIQREKLELPQIEKVEGYITHWMDAVSQQMVKDLDKFPIQSGYLYKIMKGLPKKVKNPTALKRQVKNSMEKYFSKDLGALLRTMVKYDLKDIYITAPYQAAWDELNQLRKDQQIPDSVFKEAENYLSYDIRKFKTPLDKALDATLEKPTDFINKFLLPYNRQIQSPTRSLFRGFRRIAHLSGLALRPRPAIRNLGQRLLNMDFYRASDLVKAQFAPVPMVDHPITGEKIKLLDLVKEQDWYKGSLRKFMEVDSAIRGIEAVSMIPYSRTHVGNRYLSNVEVSALTGYYDWQYRYQQSQDKNSKHYKHVKRMAKKLGMPVENLLTQPGDMMGDIREAVRRTQWEYMSISMPVAYRGEFAKASLVFQSWWMNYFFNHMREAINQTMTGRNSRGRALTPYGRLRAAKGTGSIVGIAKIAQGLFGIQMLKYLFLPAPGYLPPIPEFIVGVTQFIGADDDKERKKAIKRIKRSLSILIPYRAAWRDLNKLLSGEYDIWDYLVYREQKK